MKATCFISWPLAKLLDKIMGEHEIPRFNNSELNHLVKLHSKEALVDASIEDKENIGLD